MAFENYLVKIGDYTVDSDRFIALKSYKFRKNYMDKDSKRNGNGVLIRNVVKNKPNTVRFTTPPMLSNDDVRELFAGIQRNYLDADEQKVRVRAYNPKTDSYETQEMYLEEPEFTLYSTVKKTVIYEPIEFVFTGY